MSSVGKTAQAIKSCPEKGKKSIAGFSKRPESPEGHPKDLACFKECIYLQHKFVPPPNFAFPHDTTSKYHITAA